jgi:predicted transcriptional regulator
MEGITQQELARRASVSQATVSRAVAGLPDMRAVARRKLFHYIHERARERMPDVVSTAVRRVWDGSDVHAAALARIIEATADLRPSPVDGR